MSNFPISILRNAQIACSRFASLPVEPLLLICLLTSCKFHYSVLSFKKIQRFSSFLLGGRVRQSWSTISFFQTLNFVYGMLHILCNHFQSFSVWQHSYKCQMADVAHFAKSSVSRLALFQIETDGNISDSHQLYNIITLWYQQ